MFKQRNLTMHATSAEESFQPLRILITGASGMVGQNLQLALRDTLHTPLVPTSQALNLLEPEAIRHYLHTKQPDVIFHCAGKVGGIQANMADAPGFLYENTVMGLNLFKAAHEAGIAQAINLGSSCMYPRLAENPLNESQVLQGELEPTNEGYAIAKIAVARYVQFLAEKHPACIYRTFIPCNLYGAFDNFHPQKSHLIPGVIRKIHDAKTQGLNQVEIWGDGTARREFMDARDLARCMLHFVNNLESLPHLMNVGLGFDYSVLDYYVTIAEIIGYDGAFRFDTTKPAGMKQKLTDVSRIRGMGWQADISLEQGIRDAYAYFLDYVLPQETAQTV
jgi:GDP-L-fucose synthase